jgi:hypothetical protein
VSAYVLEIAPGRKRYKSEFSNNASEWFQAGKLMDVIAALGSGPLTERGTVILFPSDGQSAS